MLPKINRLNHPVIINKVKKTGGRLNSSFFSLFFLAENNNPPCFVFFVSSALVRKSTRRNRLKRTLSEAVRLLLPRIKSGSVGIFLARRDFSALRFPVIKKIVEQMLYEAGMIKTQTKRNLK